MALALVVNFTVKPGNEEKTKDLIRQLQEHTRREPGCRQYNGHQSPEEPSRFLMYELYDNQAALDAHRASPHYEQYVNHGLRSLMESRMFALLHTID